MIIVGSSTVANVPLWFLMLIVGEGCACLGAGDTREVSVLSTQFCYQSKTSLKNKVYLKKKNIGFLLSFIQQII